VRRTIETPGATSGDMDRQQAFVLFVVLMMLGSSVAYALAFI
jgi:hypothetical protein